jgi:PAS domain S-box-containing protein
MAADQGRYYALDAAQTLSTFMIDGSPDAALFSTFMGSILSTARAAADGAFPRIFAYGEMVALLCAEGNVDAALRLEQLWNDLSRVHSFDLHCAYPMKSFNRKGHTQSFLRICAEHAQVIPTENYTALVNEQERLRDISRLQQEAQTAEAETADRKEAQKSLQAFFHHGHSLAFIMKPDGSLLDVNASAIERAGVTREELIGRSIWDCAWWTGLPEEQSSLRQAVAAARAGKDVRNDCTYLDAGGAHRFADRSMTPVKNDAGEVTLIVASCNDITDRLRAEEALRRSEKLAATGRLAASIAHEINNPLEAVTNALFLARTDPSEVDNYLKLADEELARVAQITKQTLGFYRESAAPTSIRVSVLLDGLLSLYSRKLQSKNLSIRKQCSNEIEIWGSAGELRQVFANQIVNAIDAMPQGGCLTIRLRKSRFWQGDQCPGMRVSLVDNGAGIPHESLRKVFDPFYTTKEDLGTGLGLWITHGIVRRHGGNIRVRSDTRPGRNGTMFMTFLPERGCESNANA